MPGMPKVSFYGSPNLEKKSRSIGEIDSEKTEELHYATPKRKKILKNLSATYTLKSSMVLLEHDAQVLETSVTSNEIEGIAENKDNEKLIKNGKTSIDEDDVPIFERFVKNNDSDIKKPKRSYVKKMKKVSDILNVRKSPRIRRSLNLQFANDVQKVNNEEANKEIKSKQSESCVLSMSSHLIYKKDDSNSHEVTLNKENILDSDESIENDMNYANYAMNDFKQLKKETGENRNEVMNGATFGEHLSENVPNVININFPKITTVSPTKTSIFTSSNAKVLSLSNDALLIANSCPSIENSNLVEKPYSKSSLSFEASEAFTTQCKNIPIEVEGNNTSENQTKIVNNIFDISPSKIITSASTPTQPLPMANQTVSTSNQSISISTSKLTQSSSTPSQPSSIPNQSSSTPNQPSSTPNQSSSTPNQSSITSSQPSTLVSILRKRKLQSFPKDTPPSKKVAFNERIQTREIPSRKDAYPTWKHNNLLFDDFIIDDTSIKDDYNDDNSNKKISIGEADVKSIFDQNDKAYKDVASNDFMTVYPSLADCKVPIDDIIHHLTASPWIRGLKQLMKSQGITSIGDLASSKICDINQLPLPNPKIPRLLKVLDNWVVESKRLNNPNLLEEGFNKLKAKTDNKVDKWHQVIDKIVTDVTETFVANTDVVRAIDENHWQDEVCESLKDNLNSSMTDKQTPLVVSLQSEANECKNDDFENDCSTNNFTKIIENKTQVNCIKLDEQRKEVNVEKENVCDNEHNKSILHYSLELNQVDAANLKVEAVLDKLTELNECLKFLKEDCDEKDAKRDMKKKDLKRVVTGFNDLQNLLHQIVLKFI